MWILSIIQLHSQHGLYQTRQSVLLAAYLINNILNQFDNNSKVVSNFFKVCWSSAALNWFYLVKKCKENCLKCQYNWLTLKYLQLEQNFKTMDNCKMINWLKSKLYHLYHSIICCFYYWTFVLPCSVQGWGCEVGAVGDFLVQYLLWRKCKWVGVDVEHWAAGCVAQNMYLWGVWCKFGHWKEVVGTREGGWKYFANELFTVWLCCSTRGVCSGINKIFTTWLIISTFIWLSLHSCVASCSSEVQCSRGEFCLVISPKVMKWNNVLWK